MIQAIHIIFWLNFGHVNFKILKIPFCGTPKKAQKYLVNMFIV